jgi:hypothetical protein
MFSAAREEVLLVLPPLALLLRRAKNALLVLPPLALLLRSRRAKNDAGATAAGPSLALASLARSLARTLTPIPPTLPVS